MKYSLANGQWWVVSIMKNLLEVCRMSWIMEWYYMHLHPRFILTVESSSVNGSKWWLMDPIRIKWHVSTDLLACAICMCFFKGMCVIVFKWLSVVHMLVCEAVIVLQSKCIKLFRDTATGPNLSFTTDHMCLLHSLDFGCIQWFGWWNCFWLCLLLLSTVCPCRFPFHTQVITLTRSYYRLSSLSVTSVDGCCFYIIIHNSILHRTWLQSSVC